MEKTSEQAGAANAELKKNETKIRGDKIMNSFHVIPIFVIMVIIIVSICVGKFFNMDITNIINIIAIMLAPIFAIYFGRIFQDRSERRADKMRTFKVLMRDRNFGWTSESVNELNTIYITFSDDIDVINQWEVYFKALNIQNPSQNEANQINLEKIKLIEAIANSLGYKNKIRWDIIQNSSYKPRWLEEFLNSKQRYDNNQLEIAEKLNIVLSNFIKEKYNGKNANGNPRPD